MGNGQPGGARRPSGQQPQDQKTGFGYDAQAISNQRAPTNVVQVAVSPIGGIPGAQAYHSSVIINGEEFSFSDGGITIARGTDSHDAMAKQNNSSTQVQIKTEVFDMGLSQYSGSQVKAALERHFQPGTYDLLRKNCNSFSDCCLSYLLKKRLDQRYRQLELLGSRNPALLQQLSGGNYTPNPKTEKFDLEQLIKDIDPDKVWDMKGEATGGNVAKSADEMRAARLARLGGGASPAAAAAAPPAPAAPASSSSGAPAAGGYPTTGAAPPAAPRADGGI